MKKIILLIAVLLILIQTGCTKKEVEQALPSYPSQNIEVIVPYAAGGSTDIGARFLASSINKNLPEGINLVVVNKPGGGATIGTTEVVDAKPDGYKILMTSTSPLTIVPHEGNTKYKYNDVVPILRLTESPQMLVVKADSEWITYEDFLAYVKKNPGKFTYGTGGIGTSAHLVMENLNIVAGIETTTVPYDSTAKAQVEVLGGHIDGFVVGFLAPNDMLRPLFSYGMKSPTYKDVPTLKEKGLDTEINLTMGLFAPKGTPEDVQKYLHDAFKKALEDPAVIEGYAKTGVVTSYANAKDFAAQLEKENQAYGVVMEKIGRAK